MPPKVRASRSASSGPSGVERKKSPKKKAAASPGDGDREPLDMVPVRTEPSDHGGVTFSLTPLKTRNDSPDAAQADTGAEHGESPPLPPKRKTIITKKKRSVARAGTNMLDSESTNSPREVRKPASVGGESRPTLRKSSSRRVAESRADPDLDRSGGDVICRAATLRHGTTFDMTPSTDSPHERRISVAEPACEPSPSFAKVSVSPTGVWVSEPPTLPLKEGRSLSSIFGGTEVSDASASTHHAEGRYPSPPSGRLDNSPGDSKSDLWDGEGGDDTTDGAAARRRDDDDDDSSDAVEEVLMGCSASIPGLNLPKGCRLQDLERQTGNKALTFLEVATCIVDELEEEMEGRQDDFRFLRDCLNAGLEQLQLPCGLQQQGNSMLQTIRKSICISECTKDTTRPSCAMWRTPPSRGALRSLRVPIVVDDKAKRGGSFASEFGGGKETGSSNDRFAIVAPDPSDGVERSCPWMGPAVPRWPRKVPDDQGAKLEKMLLSDFGDWNFDIFQFAEAADWRPLQFIGYEAFCRGSCFSEFPVKPENVCAFFREVEDLYQSPQAIPFHNNVHASDVTQTIFALLTGLGANEFFDPMDVMGMILAAVVHDLGHDGRTNSFHVNVQDDLALTYNDKSVLENLHVSQFFKLLAKRPEANLLEGLSVDQCHTLRKEIISMVLGTDMAYHFHAVSEFKALTSKNSADPVKWHEDEKAMDLCRTMVLHAADLSNPGKGIKVSLEWSERCLREFFSQGDEEQRRGLLISPLCDRRTVHVPGSQIGFIEFVVQPTFICLAAVFPRVEDVCLKGIDATHRMWLRRKAAAAKGLDDAK